MIHQQAVLVGLERLHLERNLLEVLLDDLHRVGHVLHARRAGSLARHEQNMLERVFLDRAALLMNLVGRQDGPMNLVRAVETAVDAVVLTYIGQIERNIELHHVAEPAAGNAVALGRHRVEIFVGRRRNERGEIIHRRPIVSERRLYRYSLHR